MLRGFLSISVAAIILLITTFIPNTAKVTYSDILGCEIECSVVATGYPIPFIADYPGLSPADSADLMGLLMGWDRILWINFAVSAIFILFISLILVSSLLKSTITESSSKKSL
jgi:hypothetical protein